MEDLTLYNEIVLESDALVDLIDGVLWISWNNAVHQSAVYSACLLEPCLEALTEIPEVDVLIDALLEFLAVKEDKLAWEDDESLAHVTIEMLVSAIQKLGQLARI